MARSPAAEAVWRAAQKAAADAHVEDGDEQPPVAEVVSFKPLIRKATRNLTIGSRSSGQSGPDAPALTPTGSARISRGSAAEKTPSLVRQLTGGLAMLTKGKSTTDLGGGGLGGFLTRQFSKGTLDKKLKPHISLDELRLTIQKNLAEEPSLTLFDYYKTEGTAQRIARSATFENITLFVIALNAIWMAVDTNWNKADSIVDAHPVFIVAENIFCLYFTVEWVIRLMAFEEKLYGLNSNWFMFDTVLVVMMVLETWVAVAILLILDDDSFSLGDVAILRLLRLLRLSRLVRMLRALPELLILVKGALRAMKTVMFVISLLFAITYVFGIAMVLLLEGTSAGAEMFPTVPQAMYSLLLYGTLLDNLVFVCAKLEESSVVGLGVFFIYIALAALTVLNMLIGVLCEMVSLVAHQEKDRMLTILAEEKLALVIKNLDQNDDFRLSKREFLDILVNPSAAQALTDIGVDPIGVIDFADLIFSNEVGQEADLSFEEFMEIILQLRGTNSSTVRHMIELKHMIAQQLDDLTREVQEYHRHMDITHSFSPASFKGDPVDSLASLRSGEGAETPSGRPSADVSVAPPGRMSHCSVKDSLAEPSVGHFHSAPDKLVADARMVANVTSELAPDIPPMIVSELAPDIPPIITEADSDGLQSPASCLRTESLASQRRSAPRSPRSSACSSCSLDAEGPDVSAELSALHSRTERMEDTLAEVLAAVQKLSAQFAADGSPCGDAPSDDQWPLAGSRPLSPLGIPGVPVPATPLGW